MRTRVSVWLPATRTPFRGAHPGGDLPRHRRSASAIVALALTLAMLVAPREAPAAPEGQMTWGVHITLVPTYFDPADTAGLVTPFMLLYALHDALVKPMPGKPAAPSLAE